MPQMKEGGHGKQSGSQKAAEVRDRAQRLIAEYAADLPAAERVPLSAWLSEQLLGVGRGTARASPSQRPSSGHET